MVNEILKIIEDKTGVESSEVTIDSFFEDDLNIGEMELIEIITEVEDKFQIEIDHDERSEIETVQDLIDLVSEKVE